MDPKEVYMSKPWLEFYPEGVPHEVDVPDTSIPDVFDIHMISVAAWKSRK